VSLDVATHAKLTDRNTSSLIGLWEHLFSMYDQYRKDGDDAKAREIRAQLVEVFTNTAEDQGKMLKQLFAKDHPEQSAI
jgi:hypothetical protein